MINGNKVILLFGLPGAGKTTALQELLSSETGLSRLSGGTLISAEMSESDRDQLRKVGTDKILINQETLVINFKRELEKFTDTTVVFDGHCIVKDGDSVVEIPMDVIQRLEPDKIIFFDTSPDVIFARRNADPARPDRERETEDQLKANRENQIAICDRYAAAVKIPFIILTDATVSGLKAAVAA